jgi:hypothetical protein
MLIVLLLILGGLILGVLAIPALVVLGGIAAAGLGALALIVVPPVVALAGLVGSGIATAFSSVRALVAGRREEPVSVMEQTIPERQLQPAASIVDEIPYNVAARCQEQKLVPCPI